MRKLNGITINGEFLGNSVIINGMFRAICAISPVIMREFVLIINRIEILDEAVKISNFNCDNDKNCMDIEFENKKSKGVASLFFKLYNGEPELTDCKLKLNDQEYSTVDEIPVPEPVKKIDKKTVSSDIESEKQAKLQALKEAKLAKLKQKKSPVEEKIDVNSNLSALNKLNSNKLSSKEQKMQALLEKKRKLLEEKNNNSESISESITTDSSNGNITDAKNNSETLKSASNKKQTNSEEDSVTSKVSENINETLSNENSDDIKSKQITNSFDSDITDYNDTDSNDLSSANENNEEPVKLSLDDFTEEELENLSLEELEQLERELAQDDDTYTDDNAQYRNDYNQASTLEFAEKISQGLADGITQGLTQGLVQGLAQGLSEGLSQGLNSFSANYNHPPASPNTGFDNSFMPNSGNQFSGYSNNFNEPINNSIPDNFNLPSANDNFNSQHVTVPDNSNINNSDTHNRIITGNNNLLDNSYMYDENSNAEDLADFYSNFYGEAATNIQTSSVGKEYGISISQNLTSQNDQEQDELEKLKAELASLRDSGAFSNKMTLDEYMARQREIEEAKEKLRRRKIKIVGSRGKVNAKALENNVYVSGGKVYKWGDTRCLSE